MMLFWTMLGLVVALATVKAAGTSDHFAAQMQSRAVDTGVDLRVYEDQPIGTHVGKIPIKSGFQYRFNEPPKEFVLDSNTGDIRTSAVLDRESIERYAFVVLSSQPTYPIEVRIRVMDVNDNFPEFPEPSIAVSFSESTASGTRVLLDAATDKDLAENGITNDYKIIDGDSEGKFTLNVTVNPSGQTSYLHLETTGKLDRETNDFYILNISARDGGNPPKYGFLTVNVTILDVNDNPPIFDQSDFSVSLNESVPPGTQVLKVTATDSDLGENSKITYDVIDPENQFVVDPEFGVISTSKMLTCPKYCSDTICNMTCVLTVIARDHGVPRQDARTYVTVNLIDANDHDPLITFTYVPATANFATVDENAKNGSLVAAITVTDLDAGLNGKTNVKITSGNELKHFRLENSSSVHIVHVNGVLDREKISKYNLTVVAADMGIPSRTSSSFLIIQVNDINDHEPVFEKSEYSAILSELAPSGTYVAGITATDEDTGVNAEIYYDFSEGNQNKWFLIDHYSGLVTTSSYLDREIQGTVELNVSARDGGPNPKWAYTRLKVTILDENDEAPKFSEQKIYVTIPENLEPITDIITLTATDHDQGTNGSVSYYIQSNVEQKYPNTFSLDPATGQLSTKTRLDREKISSYEIQIQAKDQGYPQQSSTATVFLKVDDVNDNSPIFYPQKYFVSIKENATPNSSILRVKAHDFDEGVNAKIEYFLESGGDGYFKVVKETGMVLLNKELVNAPKPIYSLVISCSDKGNLKASENAQVEIIKQSYQKNIQFSSNVGYDFKVVEDNSLSTTQTGRYIGKVNVVDPGEFVTYFIVEGDEKHYFRINEKTGVIVTNDHIDRETKMTYYLKVFARSGLAFGFTTVSISVLDVNDNYPNFIKDQDEVHIPENMAVGQEVYFARASDKDSGVNRTVSYALSYNPDYIFKISQSTGVIYLNRPVQSEPGTITTIEVTATDGGIPSLSSKNIVTIIIDDVNDHTPVFDHTSYEISISESTLVNTRFFVLSATDTDTRDNGRISYHITEGNTDDKFGIFPDGYLYVKHMLDREDRDYYALTITATDYGEEPRSSQVPVIIHVLDENDNNPKFVNSTFTFSIKENEPADTFVGKISAMDKDIGRNAELTFSLSSDQNDFAVDSRNGFIRTLRTFDRENLVKTTGQNFIVLTASVKDHGNVRLQDFVKVTIYITDVNDNPPVFLKTPYNVEVSEGTSIGSSVMRIICSDADEGLNGDIFYKIVGENDEKFSLDEATGQLTIRKALDRETADKYVVTVVAYDLGHEKQLTSSTTIVVTILDENDNAPEFTQSQLNVSIPETEPVNKKIIQFHANDLDLGINSEVVFSITSGNRKDVFFIDPMSGILYLHKAVDYEELSTYILNITASDNGKPSLSSTISFVVSVTDANDNAPIFTNTAIVRQIREGIPKHTPIVTVTAEDPDSGLNGQVFYSIKYQEPNSRIRYFGINNITGVIHTLLPIDRETIDTFRITVVAKDKAEPESSRLSSEKLVTVIVEDINDNAPIFVSMNAAVVSSERLGRSFDNSGIFVMNVLARDLDSGTNGLVTYKLTQGGNDMFNLHRSNGALTLRRRPPTLEARWNLVIKATDEAVLSDQKSTETYLTIIMGGTTIEDISWLNPPKVTVFENEPAGTAIMNLTNSYKKSKLDFFIINVMGNGKQVDRVFDIDSGLGILSTAVALDRESGVSKYLVEICAVSAGSPLQTSTTKVEVEILDKNDSPPEFKNIPKTLTASEDLAPGQPIATIKAEDPDTFGTLSYSIVSDIATPFSLDRDSGVLSLYESLDRETKAEYEITVRASDGVQTTDVIVIIEVIDTNDNPPIFTEVAYSFDIAENAPRGSIVGTVAATDPDFGVNAQLTYTVISDWANDVFSLNPQTGVFTLTARLDYEEVQHYILVVQAQDNGHPVLSSTVTVYCNVVDINDNAPVFDPMSFSNEIFENISIASSVITVSATDLDSEFNGKLKFSIISGDDNNDFDIVDNGTIYTRHHLDRETISVYNLIVTAKDQAKFPEQQLSSTVQVTIYLKDVNDMAPEFVSTNETSIAENIPLNTAIMTVKAVDKDEGRNGYIEYFMKTERIVDNIFSLGPTDGVLRAIGKLDRELKSKYTLLITAKDRGDPPKSTETKLKIKILDENDNSPVFDPKQYSASVPENASIGASVLQISATDIDEDLNGIVRYSILSGDENRDFSISEDTGIVRVAKNLNYERKSCYQLIVKAEDCAENNVRFDTAEVSIVIQDINDNAPTFLDSPYLAFVMENVIPPNDGYILTVKAYDSDAPPFNNQVRYFIKEGEADLFKINASTGEIYLQRTLDREIRSRYVLQLVAMDTGSPPLTGSGTVQIIVQDVNDNTPKFERQTYSAIIDENLPTNTTILTPIAHDKDAAYNAKIKFSILGEKAERFYINPETGVIYSKISFDREECATYDMIIMAQDSATTDPRTTTVNLTVVIEDKNDNVPTFSTSSLEIYISEHVHAGDFVYGAKATDNDAGMNSKIIYELKGGDTQYFKINYETGVIKASQDLSNISKNIYNLVITATDRGSPPLSNHMKLSIIQKPATSFPKFNSTGKMHFQFSESLAENTKITHLHATTTKKGLTGTLSYAVAGGNIGDAIRIDSVTGEVFVTDKGFDYETLQTYEIWFEVKDSDNPPLKSFIQLEVTVLDANDNAPVFEKNLYHASVLEEQYGEIQVKVVSAQDDDSGENGKVIYELLDDFDETFEIDLQTGEITTREKLDRENIPVYELTVIAKDQGVPQLTGTATVVVNVLDENDNPPRFTRLFSVNVTENAEIGSFVIQVTSSDQDIGLNANATYSFAENAGKKFHIDAISGNITVSGPLDREQQDEYILKIAAIDGAWRAETPITITIQDQNDNSPEFEYSYYSFNFPELQNKNDAVVGQVIATDRDKQGPNSIISYSLVQPSDLFTIDPATGEIFSKTTIKYKRTSLESSPENSYSINILATDNGKPPMATECLVSINIVDSNNNSPKFESHEHMIPVPVDAMIGESIFRVVAKDPYDFGINAEIEYFVASGNGSDFFTIDKTSGWIKVKKRFSHINQYLNLMLKAVDKGIPPLADKTSLLLVVSGDNIYTPKFTALSYQVIVPENEPLGSAILTVSASDDDDGPNGMIRYSILSKNDHNKFYIDPETGSITIAEPLDFDSVPEYHLNITAKDLGFQPHSTTAVLTIILTDINDNPPVFNQTEYSTYLRENSPINSFIYRVKATDIDSSKNAVISYKILGKQNQALFKIDDKTGDIISKQVFDYEEKNVYKLEIVAENPDTTMHSTVVVNIYILGVNEYYPKFIQPVFHFDVSESAEIGTNVGVIQATDQDGGEDGLVYYLFVGSSNEKGFSINTQTGVIRVARYLDRETQNRVVLTVLAKNYGGIRGNDTDEAQIIVSIQDGNDPPEFLVSKYEAVISEGAFIGQEVITVKAIDKDVRPQNNQFSYSIVGGNADQDFKIDSHSGKIEVAHFLDRETIPIYKLIVGAIDSGSPPETGTAIVEIILSDINDNGPHYDGNEILGSVYENEPANTKIATLSAKDPDLPPNGAPFSFYIIGGKHKDYVSLDKYTGILKTKKTIDREMIPYLELSLQIEDSGSPVMSSNFSVRVEVMDKNDNAPTSRSVKVVVYVYNHKIPTSSIAYIKPNDVDTTGDYHCQMKNYPSLDKIQKILKVREDCALLTNLVTHINFGEEYSFSVLGNDGVHRDVTSLVKVEFFDFSNQTTEHTITVRILNMTSSVFLSNFYRSFISVLNRDELGPEKIFVYSIDDVEQNLDLSIATKHNLVLLKKETTEIYLKSKESELKKLLQRQMIMPYLPCAARMCLNGGTCTDSINVHDTFKIIDSPELIFTSPLVTHDHTCHCVDGFTGDRCEKRQDPCNPNPCYAGGQCRNQNYEFVCSCPSNREGKTCELERGDVCSSNPCKNGGTCKESSDKSSFFCLCRPGYRGNQCEAVVDSCRPNPCLNGGICVSLKPGYNCTCTDDHYGKHCESSTYGFNELSYMTFPPLDAATNDITFIFATSKSDSLLLYNYGSQSGGRSDFISLELIAGKPVFSFGGARTSITSVTVNNDQTNLADGKWHKITATRNGRVISLSTALCTEHGDVCIDCKTGDPLCYADDTGQTGTLSFNNEHLLIGGLSKADPILERPGQIHTDDFVGCIQSISINGRQLNLSNPISSRGIEATCGRRGSEICSKSKCSGFGKCIDRWRTNYCKCGAGLIAPNCLTALIPVSVTGGGYIEFVITEKHRRMQLLENIYAGSTMWNKRTIRSIDKTNLLAYSPPKSISFLFRTVRKYGVLFFSATDKYFTLLELRDGKIFYTSKQTTTVNMTGLTNGDLANGEWHNVTLYSLNRETQILVDGTKVGEDLDTAGIHDFLDPYLTTMSLGGLKFESLHRPDQQNFEGCFVNFTVYNEIQPLNGSGSIFDEIIKKGRVYSGCHGPIGVGITRPTDPLNIGITLVIVFFVILIVAIFVSFVVFRLRKQKKEKDGNHNKGHAIHSKHNGAALMGPPNLITGNDGGLGRGMLINETNFSNFMNDNAADLVRNVGNIIGPEIIPKKYKEREIIGAEHPRPQRPDIIEREVVGKSPAMRDDLHPPLPPSTITSHHTHDRPSGMDLNSEIPEHYDLENASSIAPSDIDIVYHYKGFREAGGMRKYKATPPPISSYHHKHQTPTHRHSPHHVPGYPSRSIPQTSQASSGPRQHQTTPLARLSPSSELSSQQPRILTLHDISGKPLQSALLATTSSSGGVGKDPLHSNSERSLNSPVMSQLSEQSSSASRKTTGASLQGPKVGSAVSGAVGLTAEEIERMNARQRSSSLVSTLDAVSSSSEAPRGVGVGHHISHRHHSPQADNQSSSASDDESGNDSFTCSEIEYDNNSMNADKYKADEESRRSNPNGPTTSKPPMIPPPPYDGFETSFRGSLSTLVASDDDLAPHVGSNRYRQSNGSPGGWDYLMNWGPNFESLAGVFKDIAEIPEAVNGRMNPTLRIPNGGNKPSEEYV